MARGRPRKIIPEEKDTGVDMVENKDVEETQEVNEIALLKKQLADMEKLIQGLAKEKSQKTETAKGDDDRIRPDHYVKVMSLCIGILNLTTESKGHGKIFTFRNWGEVKRILYGDLVLLMENHPNFLKQGKYYIMNKEVIRLHGLEDDYLRILDKNQMEKILLGDNQTDAVTVFSSASETQQDVMCDIMIQRIVSGTPVDLNLADRLSRVMKDRIPNYSIQDKAEEAKTLSPNK